MLEVNFLMEEMRYSTVRNHIYDLCICGTATNPLLYGSSTYFVVTAFNGNTVCTPDRVNSGKVGHFLQIMLLPRLR